MATILPAILVDTVDQFRERLNALPPDAETVSVDIMDGTFVQPTTFADAQLAADVATDVQYELDLMVNDPLPYIHAWAKLPNTIRAVVHAELNTDIRELIRAIQALQLEAGIALLPQTNVADVEHLLNEVDMVLIRGNQPGYAGREFDPAMYKKIVELQQEYPHLLINVDIGVNATTIPHLVASGATHLCANSAIFKQTNPAQAFEDLQVLAHQPPVEK